MNACGLCKLLHLPMEAERSSLQILFCRVAKVSSLTAIECLVVILDGARTLSITNTCIHLSYVARVS